MEHDDHYAQIVGRETSNLNSQASGGGDGGGGGAVGVDNSSTQSLRG